MKKAWLAMSIVCILFVTASAGRAGVPLEPPFPKAPASMNANGLHVDFGNIPLYFTANRGQVDGRALFYAKASRYTLWLTEGGLVFDSFKAEKPEPAARNEELFKRPEKTVARKFQREVSRLVFLNAAMHPEIVAVDETELKVNYFIGNDPKKWHTAVPTSGAVLYKNIYKNIDLKVYGSEGRIEYDWIVRPGGDPRDIRFQYENVKKTRLDRAGNLLVATRFGELMHKKPLAYQQGGGSGNGSRATVESIFKKIGKNAYGFAVGDYDAGQELVIDPVVLAYSTYLGGIGWDEGKGIAADNSGNVYVTGITVSTNFPTLNQFQGDQAGYDAFVTKINTTQSGATSLVYSTFLGGNSWDAAYGIAVDSSGSAYVTGETLSTNFPTLNQYQTDQAMMDVFVTKLDTTQSGNASLVYSTNLGGNSNDYGTGIAVDDNSNAYVTGYTYSTNFPTLNQYQGYQSDPDVFVTKIDTAKSGSASLVYSTFLGGNNQDYGYGIAVDSSSNAYLTGFTWSNNFPTLNRYNDYLGMGDIFVTKLDTLQNGNDSLVYSTYLGGNSQDQGMGIAVDNSGNVFITGQTWSTDFPTLNQYQPDQGDADAFVTKIDMTQSGAASLVYSTFLGGNNYDGGYGIAVDNSGNAYITGRTVSTDFPTLNQYQLDQGDQDAFVTKVDTAKSGAASLIFSTYLGGSSHETGFSIAVSNSGNAYVVGYTYSTDFPIQNQYQTDQPSADAFITKISASADIIVTKSSDNPAPKVGENFNFTVTVANNGPMGATGLRIADALPAALAYQSSTATQGSYNAGTGIWNVGALASDAAAELTITVMGTTAGAVTNTASVSAFNESDPDPTNNSASASVTLIQTYTLTIVAGPGGTTSPAPGSHVYVAGTSVLLQANAASGYKFDAWSGDAAGANNPVSIIMNGNKTVTANFLRGYTLNIIAGAGGTTDPVPGTYTYYDGTSVGVQALPATAYEFSAWSGDVTGSANPITVVMNRDKAVQANFARAVKAPINLSGEKLLNRNVSMIEYVARLRWQPNSANAGAIGYRVYQVENGQATAIAEVGAGKYEYFVRKLQAAKTYIFGVTAVNGQGWESDMAQVTVR